MKVGQPQISVKVSKNSPFITGEYDFDLTPFLNEGSSITTHKETNSPSNSFTISLVDQPVYKGEQKISVYGALSPMDGVVIRMSHVGEPTMVFRGVITDVSLDESMSNDGRPSRRVTITGGDYGVFLRIMQITAVKGATIAQLIGGMTGSAFEDIFGIQFAVMPAGEFVEKLVNSVLNPLIAEILNSFYIDLSVDVTKADPVDLVSPFGYQANVQGTMWSHIQTHGNIGPFYEILFEDFEDKTVLVYRKPPYRALAMNGDGAYLSEVTSATDIEIDPVDVISCKRSRTERNVANWFIVRAPRGAFDTSRDQWLESLRTNSDRMTTEDLSPTTGNPNEKKGGRLSCAQNIYGFRLLEVDTMHGVGMSQGKKAADLASDFLSFDEYMWKQTEFIKQSNWDNVVFESGSIQCKGNAAYAPGTYVSIEWRSDVRFTAYVTAVTHQFEPFRGFTTSLQFIRGTEFQNRSSKAIPFYRGKGVY